jgi:hypothetical protein
VKLVTVQLHKKFASAVGANLTVFDFRIYHNESSFQLQSIPREMSTCVWDLVLK